MTNNDIIINKHNFAYQNGSYFLSFLDFFVVYVCIYFWITLWYSANAT